MFFFFNMAFPFKLLITGILKRFFRLARFQNPSLKHLRDQITCLPEPTFPRAQSTPDGRRLRKQELGIGLAVHFMTDFERLFCSWKFDSALLAGKSMNGFAVLKASQNSAS